MSRLATKTLGHSGIDVSVVGLGCNNFGHRLDRSQARAVIDAAIDDGVTFLDTADKYGATRSEEFIGEALKGRRDEVVLATKFGSDLADGWDGPLGGREYIRRAVDNSLRRLQTDRIDLYWYHRPDGLTPIRETLEGLHELVTMGKVRALGISNISVTALQEADDTAREAGLTRFTALQNEYSLLNTKAEGAALPLCERLDVAFVPFYPLASGLLTGKYQRDQIAPTGTRLAGKEQIATPEQWDMLARLTAYAQERNVPLIHVAISSLIAQPAVASVIAGASKPEQVAANAEAAGWVPTAVDLMALRGIVTDTA